MQVGSSVNYKGSAKVNEVSFRPDGTPELVTSSPATAESVWVIQPKFETPMLNFTNTSGALRPLTEAAGNLTVPANETRQFRFGVAPIWITADSADKGVFLEITEIPNNWLKPN